MSDTKVKEPASVAVSEPTAAVPTAPLSSIHAPLAAPLPGPQGKKAPIYEQRLVDDLERILRYASTARQIEIPGDDMQSATLALQVAKSQLNEFSRLYQDSELALLQSIDKLSPRIYPVTAPSLEIVQLMEVGSQPGDERQQAIRKHVKSSVDLWMIMTMNALMLSVFTAGAASNAPVATVTAVADSPMSWLAVGFALAKFLSPLALGFLGACSFILRGMLHSLASQTFVPRDGSSYALRAMLGITLGFMIPNLFPKTGAATAVEIFGAIAIPFLAGYAADPIFAALDTIVTTLRDVVTRQPLMGRPKLMSRQK